MISYYDATNKALKFASSPDGGKTWNVHTVMKAAGSDIGRYSKMLIVSGKPVIGFLVLEQGMMGWAQSRVVLATGNVAVPASESDWSMQNALVDPQTPLHRRALRHRSGVRPGHGPVPVLGAGLHAVRLRRVRGGHRQHPRVLRHVRRRRLLPGRHLEHLRRHLPRHDR